MAQTNRMGSFVKLSGEMYGGLVENDFFTDFLMVVAGYSRRLNSGRGLKNGKLWNVSQRKPSGNAPRALHRLVWFGLV